MIETENRKIVEDFLIKIDLQIKQISEKIMSANVGTVTKLNLLDDQIELIRIEHEMRMVLFNTRTHQ